MNPSSYLYSSVSRTGLESSPSLPLCGIHSAPRDLHLSLGCGSCFLLDLPVFLHVRPFSHSCQSEFVKTRMQRYSPSLNCPVAPYQIKWQILTVANRASPDVASPQHLRLQAVGLWLVSNAVVLTWEHLRHPELFSVRPFVPVLASSFPAWPAPSGLQAWAWRTSQAWWCKPRSPWCSLPEPCLLVLHSTYLHWWVYIVLACFLSSSLGSKLSTVRDSVRFSSAWQGIGTNEDDFNEWINYGLS